MSAQASFWFLEDLNIIRFEPPTNVNALPAGPVGIGGHADVLARRRDPVLVVGARDVEPSTHGPPIQTASRPPLNWFSTCVPSRSSMLLSNRPFCDQVGHEVDALLRPAGC